MNERAGEGFKLVEKVHGIVWEQPALSESTVDVADMHFKLMAVRVEEVH